MFNGRTLRVLLSETPRRHPEPPAVQADVAELPLTLVVAALLVRAARPGHLAALRDIHRGLRGDEGRPNSLRPMTLGRTSRALLEGVAAERPLAFSRAHPSHCPP